MSKFYIKEGAWSLSIDWKIYNEGDEVEIKAKQAKILKHLFTDQKPEENKGDEDENKDVLENGNDEPKTDDNGDDEENKGDENIDPKPDDQDDDETDEIDLATLDIDGLKALASDNGVAYAENIWVDTLRDRLVDHFTK